MIYKAREGQISYGEVIGILMLDTFTPFIPGDVGNASTYSFPVRFETVKGLTVKRIFNKDQTAYDSLLESAQNLAAQGVKAITGDCGFMAIFQQELANKMDIPIFLSSMLQVQFMASLFGKNSQVGIISANGNSINDKSLLTEVGIDDSVPIVIRGLEDKPYFYESVIKEVGQLDPAKIEREVVEVAKKMVDENPEIKSILLECSVLPPYAKAVQQATKLPVFDYLTMINYVYSSLIKHEYNGIY